MTYHCHHHSFVPRLERVKEHIRRLTLGHRKRWFARGVYLKKMTPPSNLGCFWFISDGWSRQLLPKNARTIPKIVLALLGHKYIFLKTNKAEKKHCESWQRESGTEFHKKSSICKRRKGENSCEDHSKFEASLSPRGQFRSYFGLMEAVPPWRLKSWKKKRYAAREYVLTKNEGPLGKKIAQKSRNICM